MKIVGSRSIASLVAVVLNVAWWGMAVAMVVAIWLAALPLWFDVANAENVRMDIPVWFTLEADPVPASAPELGIGNAEIRDTRAEGSLVFAPPSRVFVSLVALGLVGTFTIVWWIVTELRAVFRTLRAGRPFVPENAGRIRRIAYALLLAEGARIVGSMAGGYYWFSHVHADGLTFLTGPDLNITGLAQALIILVLSEVFRAGTRLDEDQALTV